MLFDEPLNLRQNTIVCYLQSSRGLLQKRNEDKWDAQCIDFPLLNIDWNQNK